MPINRWIFHIAGRYFLTKRKEKGHTASILSIVGIAVGVMTLVAVLAVMNGFQQGFITNINEIRSYHIRVETKGLLEDEVRNDILSVDGVQSLSAFADIQTIIRGFLDEQEGALIRAVSEDVLIEDEGFASKITMSAGDFDLAKENSIVIGADLARAVGIRVGDTVNLLSLAGKGYDKLSPVNLEFTVTGLFRSGYYEINRSMAFISLKSLPLFLSDEEILYGIKLKDHYNDRAVMKALGQMEELEGIFLESWRQYNKSFFSALLMEKLMMMILISLIFIVVAVNIYHSMKRSVVERIDEIALMKAVGATPMGVQSVFILEGAIIGVFGSALGVFLGYAVTYNINGIFSLVETIVNTFSAWFTDSVNDLNIYTGSSYFLQRVPVEIMVGDVVYITAAAVLSALTAAWIASRGVSSVKPAVVLRYE